MNPNKTEKDSNWWEELSDLEQAEEELKHHQKRVQEIQKAIIHLRNKEVLKDIEGIDDEPV